MVAVLDQLQISQEKGEGERVTTHVVGAAVGDVKMLFELLISEYPTLKACCRPRFSVTNKVVRLLGCELESSSTKGREIEDQIGASHPPLDLCLVYCDVRGWRLAQQHALFTAGA